MKQFIILLLVVMIVAGCKPKAPKEKISTLFENYYEDYLKLYPFTATSNGDNRYNDQFPIDITASYREKQKAFYTKYLKAIEEYDKADLNDNEQTSYDILKWECEGNLAALEYQDDQMPINQFWAKTLEFPQMGSGSGIQPFKTEKDYDNWLARMSQFPIWCDTAIANMKQGMQSGWVLPQILAKRVLPQLTGVITNDATSSVFYTPIKNLPATFSDDAKKKYTAAFTNAINEQIIPSYKKLADFFEKEYIPKTRQSHGISDVPNGKAYYAMLAKTWTTTNLTPDEIFEIGKKEVARIKAEMETVKTQTGFKGDLKAFFKFVNDAPELHPYKKDEEVIAGFQAIYDKMKPNLIQQYDLVPKSKFEIRQTEAFREASASAEYQQGTPDGSRPGIFYCPVLDATKYNIFQDEALFLHEAIPGHHYQISLQQENKDLPKFRQFLWYGAYGEGYALYTESLGKELGLYTNPYQYFGKLSMEMHRALRLVVDVGIHVKGWTREQAIAYSMENEADSEESIAIEIERYMAIPGQALGYKIGQLKILELKAKAKTELGTKFNIKEFHNELLKYGCVPIAVLESKMNAWIAKNK